MGYFDDYKKRVQADGVNEEDAITKSSINLVNKAFAGSSSYASIILNGVPKEARVNLSKDSKEIDLLYRPLSISNVGDLIIYNNINWLVFEVKNHEVYPTANAKKCNESLKWKDAAGSVREYKAVTESGGVSFGIDDADKIEMNALEGEMRVYVQYNSLTKLILPTQRFILGSQVYEVKGMDDITYTMSGIGLIKFSLRLTTKQSLDDFTNKIANNSHLFKPTGGSQGGGGLW